MLLLFILITFCCARPERPPLKEGEVRNIKGQKHFTYNSNDNLKRSSRSTYDYKYDIELNDGFHSLDDEEYIEDVKCFEDHLEILSTTKEPIGWKEGDTLSGSEMWKCETVITQKIQYVDYEGEENGFHKFFVKTEAAGFSDFFANADVKFENHVSMEEMMKKKEQMKKGIKGEKKQSKQEEYIVYSQAPENNDKKEKKRGTKKSQLKKGDIGFELLSPQPLAFREMSAGIIVNFRVTGCTSYTCSYMNFKFELYRVDDSVTDPIDNVIGTWSFSRNCGTSGECIGRYRFYTERTSGDLFQENIRTYFVVTITDSSENVLVDELDLDDDYFYLNSYFVSFTYPQGGEIIPRETVKVTFEASDRVKGFTYTIQLTFCQSKWGPDTCDYSKYVSVNSEYVEIDFSNTNNFKPGAQYYLKTTVNGFTTEGNLWTIAPEDPLVVISSPTIGSHYKNGDTLEISWICNGNANDEVTVYLYRAIAFAVDPEIKLATVSCGDQFYSTKLNGIFPSNDYYVDLEFDCSTTLGITLCEHSSSGYFSINMPHRAQLIKTKHFEEEKRVRVYYTISENVGNLYVSIRQQFPSILPLNLRLSGTEEKTISTYSVGSQNYVDFEYEEGSIFKTYVEINYDCVIGNILCTSERYLIEDNDIPYTMDFGYNYNSLTEGADEEEIEIFKFTCSSDQTVDNFMQELCDLFPEEATTYFEFSSICENCYFNVPIGMKNFILQMDFAKISKMHLEVETGFEYFIKLITTFNGKIEWNNNVDLPQLGQIPNDPFELSIGPVSLSLGPYLKFSLRTDVEAEVMLQIIATFSKQQILTFVMDSSNAEPFTITSTEVQGQDNGIEFYGSARLYVEPKFIAEIGFVFTLSDFTFVDTKAYLTLGLGFDIQFSYPPFAPSYEYNTNLYHFIRFINSFFIKVNAEYNLLDKFENEYENELFRVEKKQAFLEYESENDPISFTLDIVGELSTMEMAVLEYEIGKIIKNLGYDFNPYRVSIGKQTTAKRTTKQTTQGELYSVNLLSDSATNEMGNAALNEIERIKKSSSDDGSFIYSKRNVIFTSQSGSNPIECVDDANLNEGYVGIIEEDFQRVLVLYKVGICYNDLQKTTKYTKATGTLRKCTYQSGNEECGDHNYQTITQTSQLPTHHFYKVSGTDNNCEDHCGDRVIITIVLDECYERSFSFFSPSYRKYICHGNDIFEEYFEDKECTESIPNYRESVATCGQCEDGTKYYCSPFSIPEASNPTNPNEPEDGEQNKPNNPGKSCQIEYSNNKLIVKGCESIEQNDVDEYKQATTIEIGDGVEKIKEKAFEGFTNVQTIIIGKDVQEIGDNAFKDCSGQTQIKYNGEAVACGESVFGNKVNRVVVTSSYKGTAICGKQAIKDETSNGGTNGNTQQPGSNGNDGTSSLNVLMMMIIFAIMI